VKHTADAEAQQSIVNELADIEKLWLNTDSKLSEQLQQLESTSRLWDEVENGMASILEQLKKTRTLLMQPLSDKYDELERELRHCQVRNVDCIYVLLTGCHSSYFCYLIYNDNVVCK